jgi:3-phosphoshikimate 1-carboxyvinyltransferase
MHIVSAKTQIIQGVIDAPSSKSEAIRALFFALLCPATSHIHNMLEADDVNDAILVCQALGAVIERKGSTLSLTSSGAPFSPLAATFKTGNSGLATRITLPLLGLRKDTASAIQLDCNSQMRARPMSGLINALNQLGMRITSTGWPLTLSGSLSGGNATITEPISQYLSALLMTLPLAEHTSTIYFEDIPAWSYVDMTLTWLNRLGILFTHDQNMITIPGKQQYRSFEYTLSGDFSSASYFIAAATMLPGSVRIKGLDMNDRQGDKQLLSIIEHMGGDVSYEGTDILINGGKPLTGICIDASNIPDLLPTLSVLGTFASGKTEIIHVAQARLKETDRIHSMTEGLTRLGARIEEAPDGMTIYQSSLSGAAVKGYQDHRTVMALSLAGLIADGETLIDDAHAVRKTCPDFVTHMQSLGANMEIKS